MNNARELVAIFLAPDGGTLLRKIPESNAGLPGKTPRARRTRLSVSRRLEIWARWFAQRPVIIAGIGAAAILVAILADPTNGMDTMMEVVNSASWLEGLI